MKTTAFPLLLLMLCTGLIGCRRDCDNLVSGKYVEFSPALTAWMTDSAKFAFDMVDADSSIIRWESSSGGKQWYECTEKPMRRHELHETRYTAIANSAGEKMAVALRQRDDESFLIVEFNDALIYYFPDTQEFATTRTDEGQIIPSGEMLATYRLRGKDWQDVLLIDTHSSFVTYPKIWLAKGWGIIRYENQAGKAWERLP